MIGYFDTSALVPLLLNEPTSALCRELWGNADSRVTTNLAYAEVSAALARAQRSGRITKEQHHRALIDRTRMFNDITTVTMDDDTVELAGELAADHALRGYDSLQCATATRLWSTAMVAITGDHDLAEAWRNLGVYTIDTTEMAQR